MLFYLLWLAEILPAVLANEMPRSLADAGLPTNPVHVIDLSVFLPGVLITGVLLLKQRPLGYLLTPVLLTFFVLMDITIGTLMLILNARGQKTDLGIAVMMAIFAIFSLILLILHLRQFRTFKQ
jgi:hypothetical protein